MSIAGLVTSRSRLFFSAALLLTAVGAYSWFTMPRQEDPPIPARAALIVAPLPGASAAAVERLILEPLEDALGEVDGIKVMHSTALVNAAVTVVELRDEISDVEPVYDEVERQIAVARRSFPDNAGEVEFDRRIFDQESILIAVTGAPDTVGLAAAADRLRHRLLSLPDVSRVVVNGDPGEQVTVELDDATSRRLGLAPQNLAAQLALRNTATPGGAVVVGRLVSVEPSSEFGSVDELPRPRRSRSRAARVFRCPRSRASSTAPPSRRPSAPGSAASTRWCSASCRGQGSTSSVSAMP